jgi:hypothetical protein
MRRMVYTIGWWSIPALWALSTQFGQILPYGDCAAQHSWAGVMTLSAVLAALVISAASGIGVRRLAGIDRFLALAGSLIALIFAFSLSLQALAATVIDPCAR